MTFFRCFHIKMVDRAVSGSGISVLSAFDKLKLTSIKNNYSINRNVIPSIQSLIETNPQQKTDVISSAVAVSPIFDTLSYSSVYEKSIESPQLPKTIIMSESDETNNSFTKNGDSKNISSICSPCSSPHHSSPIINDKTKQIAYKTTTDSIKQSLTSLLSQSLNEPSISSQASVEMVLPTNNASNKVTNFEIKQNKMNHFSTKEVSIKILKNGKCKSSVSAIKTKPNSSLSNNICAPPTKLPPYHSIIDYNSDKTPNLRLKKQNIGVPLFREKLAPNSVDDKKIMQSTSSPTEKTDERNKKKRCSDRYDSSESSDSGVATSLSCTDSNTASSDVSDPGSPYSPALTGDDLHQRSNTMPPQTILGTTNNAGQSPTTSAATPVQNVLKGSKQQQKQNKNQQQSKLTKSQLPSPLQKPSQQTWSWATPNGGVCTGANLSSEMASSPKINVATLTNNKSSNKRHSQTPSTTTDGNAKKTRTTNANSKEIVNDNSLQPTQAASNNKRLKVAAMEESQTKITGYFKSQLKAQINQSGLKKDSTLSQIQPFSSSSSKISTLSPSVTVGTILSSSTSSKNTIPIVKTSSSSLNKYFCLLNSQMHEEKERTASNVSLSLPSLPPALKKIERSKPTKIAQVAPNLRKTTASLLLPHLTEKSPKKHVAIAPRIADTRQKTESSVSSPLKANTNPSQQPQSAVLLTAIHIPQSNQPPQLVPTSPRQQQLTVGKAQSINTCSSSKIPTGASLYQIPMMPNLVQFPNLIAANVSQLTGARGNNHQHTAPTAQYFLNGTVFKLQQYSPQTGAPTAAFSTDSGNQSINTTTVTNTSTAIEQQQQSHASNNKNTSSITATSFQEMLSNQFQTQHQQQQQSHNHRLHHSQPVFMATTTGLLLNAASLPTMLSGTSKQTLAIQPQQIPALQPIQGAVMPGLSSIFSPIQEQQIQQYKSEAPLEPQMPPLQQQTNIPPLSVASSAFSKLALVKAGNAAFTSSIHQVSATQPPPLVTISSGSPIVNGCNLKPRISAKLYQLKSGQEESVQKVKRNVSDCSKKLWLDPAPLILTTPSAVEPPKSPPALVYPSHIANIEEQHKNEYLFDILKNSKNESGLTPPPSTHYQSNEDKCQEEDEAKLPHTICMESSSLLSPENTSNSTISEESMKDSPLSPAEYFLTSSSLISAQSPRLETDPKSEESEAPANITETSSSDASFLITSLSPTIDIALADINCLPKCAISPILSQPKTIRFPAKHESGHRFGPKGMRRHDGVCYWDKCNKKHESNSKLLDHMQTHHVNTQTGPFACLWLGCKVYGRESCSRRWLERHVLSHGGTKPFKCIVDGCGLRFGSQLALQKHVNGHFNATESKDSTSKRTSDPPVPKLLRKNGKKLRYRRQPFSARMFDFFDAGIMEGLHHRLRQISTLTNGKNCITFRGEIMMRRTNLKGIVECFVEWAPPNIISNEWLPESCIPYIKTLPINRLQPKEKTIVESLLRSAYRLPHSPNLFQSFHSLSRQNSQDSTSTNTYSQSSTTTTDDTGDETSRSSSFGHSSLGSISNLPLKFPQIELRQKQSRKQPKRIQPS